MLGITPADAVAIGMFVLACGAAWRGVRAGDHAKRHQPPPDTVSIGSTVFADTAAMTAQTDALNRIAKAIEQTMADHREQEKDRLTSAIEQLVTKLDKQDEAKRPAPRR